MDSISVQLFYCAVCYYTCHVWFCSDWSGRLVPQDWSEEPASGSAPDRCTDTWWAVSGHNKWFTGIWSVQTLIITILCFREHACCNRSYWIGFINIHHQLSNLVFKINLTVIARACQSVIMNCASPSRRNSWAFQRGGDWRYLVGCESWSPSSWTAGQQGERLEIIYQQSSATAHGLVFQKFH